MLFRMHKSGTPNGFTSPSGKYFVSTHQIALACSDMAQRVDAGDLDLGAEKHVRAGWAVGTLQRLGALPDGCELEQEVIDLGHGVATIFEIGMLNRSVGAGAWGSAW